MKKSWRFLLPTIWPDRLRAKAELTGCSHNTAAKHVAARDAVLTPTENRAITLTEYEAIDLYGR